MKKEQDMCFPTGPSNAEKRAAAEARTSAEEEKRLEIEAAARQKRTDISAALSGKDVARGTSGGIGRRSLFSPGSGTGRGYASRFG